MNLDTHTPLHFANLAEAERHAYITGNAEALAVIYATEEASEEAIANAPLTEEHEACIDDRDALRDALRALLDKIEARPRLEACIGADLTTAAANAVESSDLCPAFDPTLRAQLIASQAHVTELQAAVDAMQPLRELVCACEYLTEPYTGMRYGRHTGKDPKPAPKWARYLLDTLARIERKAS